MTVSYLSSEIILFYFFFIFAFRVCSLVVPATFFLDHLSVSADQLCVHISWTQLLTVLDQKDLFLLLAAVGARPHPSPTDNLSPESWAPPPLVGGPDIQTTEGHQSDSKWENKQSQSSKEVRLVSLTLICLTGWQESFFKISSKEYSWRTKNKNHHLLTTPSKIQSLLPYLFTD